MSDTLAENKVVVNIFGEDYPMTGVTDPSYISRVADFVDARMKAAAGDSRVRSRDRIAILAAMSLASELMEAKERLDGSQGELNSQADGILARLESELS
ncbi:MAG: cell division protein ZapA [candidate division Zixibacteria bacterium]|nr:cell division protein ZapA [candidate division Zixibacteria bacterium]MDH3937904.1 cell division protein ZapA [candidate division Zixibacteria bacterium]MDH4034031.1 cell division protein ZapA [candidate division Zixibacteria bacterium]